MGEVGGPLPGGDRLRTSELGFREHGITAQVAAAGDDGFAAGKAVKLADPMRELVDGYPLFPT